MKKIEILGGGCQKCSDLAAKVKAIADSMGLEYELEKVTDITKIINYGVIKTPALVINGEVKISGEIPSADEIKELL